MTGISMLSQESTAVSSPADRSEIYRYSPTTDSWELFAQLPFAGVSVGAKVVGSTLYVFGGGDGDWFDGSLARTLSLPITDAPTGDFNKDGQLDAADVDVYCAVQNSTGAPVAEFDLTGDGLLGFDDLRTLVFDILSSRFGDANLDGAFTTGDIVQVFQVGEFEDDVPSNSNWADGDWNCDGEFTSRDVVLAFQYGPLS